MELQEIEVTCKIDDLLTEIICIPGEEAAHWTTDYALRFKLKFNIQNVIHINIDCIVKLYFTKVLHSCSLLTYLPNPFWVNNDISPGGVKYHGVKWKKKL